VRVLFFVGSWRTRDPICFIGTLVGLFNSKILETIMFSRCCAFVLASLLFPVVVIAQTSTTSLATQVPTTKILAIGRGTATPEQLRTILPNEVPDTVRLYLTGKIDQWYVRQDGKGVVFLLNCSSVDEARSLLEQLPLGKAGLMKFDLIALGPLNPLRILLTDTPPTSK
jgi:hypothetical protein